MELVEVDRVFDSVGAEIVRGFLQSAGIDAVLFDSGLASLLGGVSGVRVMVAPDDEAAARALLAGLSAP
ncbi:MAG: putative signal transducing protein [Polymorphobacter sp.]